MSGSGNKSAGAECVGEVLKAMIGLTVCDRVPCDVDGRAALHMR